MDILEIIKQRRSVRRYTAQPVPADVLSTILEAGAYAPSGGNNQTTHFLVVQSARTLALLKKTAAEEFSKMTVSEGMYRNLAATIRLAQRTDIVYDFTYGAPVLILLANKRGYTNAMADCALAVENMFLQAAAMGIASCYVNQIHWLTDNGRMLELLHSLGLAEDEQVCLGAVFGYSAAGDIPPLPRFGNPVTYVS